MRSAVARAVPEGASSFPSWWSSTISAAGNTRAAMAAKRWRRTAPMAKLGATTTFDSVPPSSSNRWISATCSGPTPVVPTTMCMACSMAHRTLSITASGRVKSTATSVSAWRRVSISSDMRTSISGCPIIGPSGLPSKDGLMPATSARSGSSATAWLTSLPIRPAAPSTPTRITDVPPRGQRLQGKTRSGRSPRRHPRRTRRPRRARSR